MKKKIEYFWWSIFFKPQIFHTGCKIALVYINCIYESIFCSGCKSVPNKRLCGTLHDSKKKWWTLFLQHTDAKIHNVYWAYPGTGGRVCVSFQVQSSAMIWSFYYFQIWIQNPWSIWNFNPESLDWLNLASRSSVTVTGWITTETLVAVLAKIISGLGSCGQNVRQAFKFNAWPDILIPWQFSQLMTGNYYVLSFLPGMSSTYVARTVGCIISHKTILRNFFKIVVNASFQSPGCQSFDTWCKRRIFWTHKSWRNLKILLLLWMLPSWTDIMIYYRNWR